MQIYNSSSIKKSRYYYSIEREAMSLRDKKILCACTHESWHTRVEPGNPKYACLCASTFSESFNWYSYAVFCDKTIFKDLIVTKILETTKQISETLKVILVRPIKSGYSSWTSSTYRPMITLLDMMAVLAFQFWSDPIWDD